MSINPLPSFFLVNIRACQHSRLVPRLFKKRNGEGEGEGGTPPSLCKEDNAKIAIMRLPQYVQHQHRLILLHELLTLISITNLHSIRYNLGFDVRHIGPFPLRGGTMWHQTGELAKPCLNWFS